MSGGGRSAPPDAQMSNPALRSARQMRPRSSTSTSLLCDSSGRRAAWDETACWRDFRVWSHDGAKTAGFLTLKPETWAVWLGEKRADASALKALLVPFRSEEMTCWPVSALVGNVKNNDPSLIEAIAA
jgi:hypothetical protein